MKSITFTTHTIRVHSVNNRNENLPIRDFEPGCDLFRDFIFFLSEFQTRSSLDERRRERLTVSNFSQRGRSLKGLIETGEYGYESSIVDVTSNLETYRRRASEAEMLPFFFTFIAPRNSNEGILGLQRLGQKGIQTILFQSFESYFMDLHPNFRVEMNNLIPVDAIENLLGRGQIRQIRLVSFQLPQTIEEMYAQAQREVNGSIEIIIKAGRNDYIPAAERVREFLVGGRNVTNFIEIAGFQPNEIKVDFDVNGKQRTLNISDTNSLRPDYDITSDVVIGENGHPTFESIDRATGVIIRDILSGIGISEQDVYEDQSQ